MRAPLVTRQIHASHDARDDGDGIVGDAWRSRVEPGFLFEIVDDVIEVPDAASIAAAWPLDRLFGRRNGGSSGTNFVACLPMLA